MRQTLQRVLDDLGRRLAELRHQRGWTQAQIADKAGMLTRDYQAIEAGTRAISIRTAHVIAQALGVDLDALFVAPTSRDARRAGRPARSKPAPDTANGADTSAAEPGPHRQRRKRG